MQNENSFNGGFAVVKGVLCALACSLVLTVVFASILRGSSWSSKVIYPVNQGIKMLSVLIGTLLFVRGEKGWLKGLAIGILFTMLSYLVFSAIGGDFSLSWLVVVETLLGATFGLLSGAIGVNLRR